MPTYGFGLHAEFPADEFAQLCAVVDEAGFERLWIPDERFLRDVAVALTAAAMSTERIGIGTAVTDPFIRHPALTAVMAASIDEVSHGRLTLGIGAGISGFPALGIERAHPERAIRGAVGLMRTLWRGEHERLDGDRVTSDIHLHFSPLRAAIPIWIAGRGARILQLAGEIADGALIGAFCSEPGLRYANGQIDRGLEIAGRERGAVRRGIWLHTAIAEDAEAARDAVRPIVAGVLISSGEALRSIGIPLPADLMRDAAITPYGMHEPRMLALARRIPRDVLDHFCVAGSPTEVAARLAGLDHFGIDHVSIVPWLARGQSIRTFISELADAVGLPER